MSQPLGENGRRAQAPPRSLAPRRRRPPRAENMGKRTAATRRSRNACGHLLCTARRAPITGVVVTWLRLCRTFRQRRSAMQRSFNLFMLCAALLVGACVADHATTAPAPAAAAAEGKADALDWIENEEHREFVRKLALAGTPILIDGSSECPGPYDATHL